MSEVAETAPYQLEKQAGAKAQHLTWDWRAIALKCWFPTKGHASVVSSNRREDALVIVAKPNHSTTWRNNKIALLAIAIPSLGAAIGFTTLGAWPILPFAGLELAALTAALYYVNWKLEYRHVITLNDQQVLIDKGHYAPKRHWRFEREHVALAVTPEKHPWEGPRLSVHNRQENVPVGEFLNRDDCISLLALLRKELMVRTHSPSAKLKI